MYLPSLTDAELAHHADVTFDALTATDLQTELAKRFSEKTAELEASREVLDLLDEHDIEDADALRAVIDKAAALDERAQGIALLDVLREFDIDSPDELKKILDRDAKVADVMNELAQPLASLQALVTPA